MAVSTSNLLVEADVLSGLVPLRFLFSSTQALQVLSSANARNQTPLMIAAQTGREQIVKAVVGFVGESWVPADDQVGVA